MPISMPLSAGTHNLFDEERFTSFQAQTFKAELAQHITRKMDALDLTVGQAALLCDCPQADIKRIRKSDVLRFNVEEMVWLAKQFGLKVHIQVTMPKSKEGKRAKKTTKAH